jgi:archaellum component FlaF (FlaF/FlaG flagellin family)
MKHIILCCALIALAAFAMPASAYWNETGFPLEDHLVAQGTVNGSVYVGGGHGKAGALDYTTPYTELFEVPPGDVKFARLYTGGMLCSKTGATWLNMTLNGESLGNLTIEGNSDTNPNVYMYDTGSGAWIYYDITNEVISGAVNNATLYGDAFYDDAGKKLGYGTKYIYGIVMVVVYEDLDKPVTQYWIREGADYLHKEYSYAAERKNTTVTFPGANSSTCENATLYTANFFSKEELNETLWVNGQLAAYNIAGERNGYGFDINRTEITPHMESSDNYATYDRGEGSMMIGCSVLVLGEIEIIPDLMVREGLDVSLKTGETTIGVVANHSYVVEAEIKNKGTGISNETTATLHVNGALVETTNVPSISPLDATTVAFNWTPASGGAHLLNVTIDPDNAVNESIEFNNLLSQDVYVHPEELPDVLPELTFLPTRDSNETTIHVTVTNNGTADVSDLNVSLAINGVTETNNTLSLSAKSINTTEFVYSAEYDQSCAIEIELDPDGTITESDEDNNNVSDTLTVISTRVIATISFVDPSLMFDITKLVPEGTAVIDVLGSVANLTYSTPGSQTPNIDGMNTSTPHNEWFRLFINGLPYLYSEPTYHIHDGEVMLHTYESIPGVVELNAHFMPRPVCTYPEPFLHGFKEEVKNTTIVYPAGFESDATAIRNRLFDSGVVNVTTTLVGDVTDNQTENDNLILIGTPDVNNLIYEISNSYYLVGMPVYFKDGLMYDSTTGNVYSAGGLLIACDNPFDDSPGTMSYRDAGPSIMVAAGLDDASAHAAAAMLSTPGALDGCYEFWKFVSPVEMMKGDLNGDYDITTADAVFALQMSVGSRTPDVPKGDVSGDGRVTSLDALMILQAAAKNIDL